MKNSKRFLSGVLALLMFMSVSSISLFAYAEGTGTEDNPYRISTAQELQDINNNLTASYILTANIDLSGVDFEPIGNAEVGTFQGTFDGNGYTISNLNVFSGKYAGLFGCNEGVIKNVILKDIYVYGTRYVGGVVGENTPYGTVANCKVLNGEIESDGGINGVYAGGVCGFNEGEFVGGFSNGSNLIISHSNSYAAAGGIIGWNNKETELTASNTGNISSTSGSGQSYSGGLVGYGNSTITISNSYNTGNLFAFHSGGLIGYGNSTVTILNSYNTGNLSFEYSGGLIGYGNSTVTISNSYNSGNISSNSSSSYYGGLVGYGKSKVTISNSYNTGNISSSGSGQSYSGGLVGRSNSTVTISNSYNTGNISSSGSGYPYSGGLIGRSNSTVTISNSYNTGNICSDDYSGGLIGCSSSTVTISNSYNSGNFSGDFSGGLIGYGNSTVTISNSYTCELFYGSTQSRGFEYFGILLSDEQMKNQSSFENWDFDEIWQINSNVNNGYPTIKNISTPLETNISNASVVFGSSLQLSAYKNGVVTNNVTWSVSCGDCTVNSSGLVTASATGFSTITAIDSQGNKANCNIFVMAKNTSAVLNDFEINQGTTSIQTVIMGVSGDYLTNVTSSDSNVLNIDFFCGTSISLSAKSPGTVTISFKTAQGFTGSCLATVTNYATRISLSSSSLTVARGETKKLTATTSPSPTSSTITWKSSNSDVAMVDQNGNVTGVSIGSATITAETDNGYSATCYVTVNAPVSSMEFAQPSVSVYKGYTVQLNVVTDPSDTTDAITYSSSSTTIATVSTAGLVTAKATGTATITATSTSGEKAYCAITVLEAPVVATDLTLGAYSKDMLIGELYTLSATITPSTATDKTIIWKTTNSDIVDVSETGVLTAKGAGKAVVSATTSSGITKYCVVNVAGVSDGAIARIFVPDITQTGVDYIDVPVIIENNPGISFASISVGYDSNELEPIDVTNGTVFDSVTGSFDTDNSVVKLYFTSKENKTDDGNLAIIRFKVINTGAVETIVSIAYMPGGITNSAEEAVAFNLADGRVEIELCIHENTEVRNAKTATCTEQGYTGDVYCLDCGDLLETGTVLDITPHHYQTTVFEPTENKQGYTKYVCTDCGYSYVGDITDYASDNSVLIAILETIASYSKEDYSADSFANLQAIYNKYSSMATGSYAQIEIDNAAFDLITAVSVLEPYLNLDISAPNGTFTVAYDSETNSNNGNSLLFGTNVTVTATANEGYEFVGWYDTINNLYFSKNAEYSFKLTTNTSLKAVFVKEQSATLTFTTYSNWVQSTVTKTIDEWNAVTSIDELLPAVPYRYGYTNGRWVYDNAEVLAKLQTGENVSLIPEYDEDDTSLPTPPSPDGDTPVLDLHYKLDADANVGSFVMAAGIPESCQLESVGILFYYKNADEFDPTKFELLINNKMLAGRFNTDEADDIYIINMNKMSAYKNWVARGYVTYYDADGNLKTVYSNQINIVNREQV